MDWRKLRRKDICDALCVTADTVYGWAKYGCPVDPYDLSIIMEWRIQRELDKQTPVVTGAESEEALERKRHWDAENAKLKNRQLTGELLERDEVLQSITDTTHLVRSTLMNLGSELSVALSRTNDALEIRELIDNAIAEKLGGLQLKQEKE